MSISEKIKKIFKEKNLDEKDYKEIINGIEDIEKKYTEKEELYNNLKIDSDKKDEQIKELEELKKTLKEKEDKILELREKYIDTFEKGINKDSKDDYYDKDDDNSNISINDIFQE